MHMMFTEFVLAAKKSVYRGKKSPKSRRNARALAALAVVDVVQQGRSLSAVMAPILTQAQPRDRGLVQELAYGVLRWHPRLMTVLESLLQRPLKEKDGDLQALLLVGLYQLSHLSLAEHGVIHDSVEAARQLGKSWATKLVNGVLREYQRQGSEIDDTLTQHESSRYAHPQWLLERLRKDWPDDWQAIADANNQRPPMSLRVNARLVSREAYLSKLHGAGVEADAIAATEQGVQLVAPMSVEQLPGFEEGEVSVQDGAAQLATQLLDVQPGMTVLDACAAPGGKTCHVLERTPDLSIMVALDQDADRLERVEENLERLHLQAQVVAADAGATPDWWDGQGFDRILLDAPCTATGVIRRHPDIKVLRKPHDVKATVDEQQRLLAAMWSLLAPGGMLVYCTCSVLRAENVDQISCFIDSQDDAREQLIGDVWGHACTVGRQILPGEQGMDGFYYACLRKQE